MSTGECVNSVSQPRLVVPEPKYLESYIATCRESWGKVHNNYILHDPAQEEMWRHTIFQEYSDKAAGVGLPPGFVPSITYWIVLEEEVIGAVNLRLQLTGQLEEFGGHAGIFLRPSCRGRGYAHNLLRQVIELAHQKGIEPLLLTCIASNEPSRRNLQSIKPLRQDTVTVMADGVLQPVCRFWF